MNCCTDKSAKTFWHLVIGVRDAQCSHRCNVSSRIRDAVIRDRDFKKRVSRRLDVARHFSRYSSPLLAL